MATKVKIFYGTRIINASNSNNEQQDTKGVTLESQVNDFIADKTNPTVSLAEGHNGMYALVTYEE